MFNLFKKQESNPLMQAYSDLTKQQRMSILNLLMGIALSDNSDLSPKELDFIVNYQNNMLNVKIDESYKYFDKGGANSIINDLKPIMKSKKDFLILAAHELITCDGQMNKAEAEFTIDMFEKLGISEDEVVMTLKQINSITNQLFGK